ncbi:MAG: LPS export ABC transporter periplasmic protein LptC [Thermoanaerobaculia bacterium]
MAAAQPFRTWRTILLALLILTVAALVGLFALGRRRPEVAAEPSAGVAGPSRPDVVAASDRFEYTQMLSGRPVLKVAGDRFSATRDGKVHLDGVTFVLYREERSYEVHSREALYDQERQEATLRGEVRLVSGDGLTLTTEHLELVDGGKRITGDGPVELAREPGYRGRGSAISGDLERELFVLAGPAVVESTAAAGGESTRLEAQQITAARREARISADGAVVLTSGASRLSAPSLDLFLAADESSPRVVQARGGVEGEIASTAAEGAPLAAANRLSARRATLEFDPTTHRPAHLELEGEKDARVLLASVLPDGTVREIAALHVVAAFVDGELRDAQAYQPAFFAEYLEGHAESPLRHGQADQAEAEFGAGQKMARVTLVGNVRFKDPRVSATGERGFFDLDAGRGELLGRRVVVVSDRGTLVGPHVEFHRGTGLVEADGGVEAEMKGRALQLPGAAASADPVRVQAQEAIFQDTPRNAAFRGAVRAWQGKNLLLADQLHAEQDGERLSAAGNVKTVVIPQPAADGKPQAPVEVTAATLTYRKAEARLIYSGPVVVTQNSRSLACDELVGDLDAQQRVRTFHAKGNVRLSDPLSNRQATGDLAEYDVDGASIAISGAKVEMRDRDGNVIRGRRLIYDTRDGTARMSSGDS